jgi:hypothetical protein
LNRFGHKKDQFAGDVLSSGLPDHGNPIISALNRTRAIVLGHLLTVMDDKIVHDGKGFFFLKRRQRLGVLGCLLALE